MAATKWILTIRAGLIGASLLLTHVHWLILADSPQSYRIIAPLGIACLLLVYWGLMQFFELVRSEATRDWLRNAFMIVVAILAISLCQHYSEKYWIAPHSTAYRYMLLTLRDQVREPTNRVYLVRETEQDSFVSEWFIEEFGRPASDRPWMIQAMVRSAVRDSGLISQIERIEHGGGDEPIPTDEQTIVIDMRKLRLMRLP